MFGLRLSDMLWVGLAGTGDLALWHWRLQPFPLRIGLMTVVSVFGISLAIWRLQDATAAEWIVRWIRFSMGAKLFLP